MDNVCVCVFFFLLYLLLFCKFEIITLWKKQDDGEKAPRQESKGKGIWDLMGLSSHVNSAVYLYKLFHCLSLNFFNIKREKIIAIFQSCCED